MGNKRKSSAETVHDANSQGRVPKGKPIYGLEDRPPFGKQIVYSLQFVVIFIGSIVLVPAIVAAPLGWDRETVTFILQCAVFTGGVASLVQVKGLGPVGARLPILLGTTFVIINPMISITQEYGYDAFLGAVIAGGLLYALFGYIGLNLLRKIFSGAVSGTLIVSIALTLAPSCADMMGGGSTLSSSPSDWKNWLVALVTMAVCLICYSCGKGFVKTASLFLGLVTGYLIAFAMGFIDFSQVLQ